jgi:hypothetical protein
VNPRIVATPIAPLAIPRDGPPRRVAEGLLESTLPGPGRDRLAAGEVLVVTTGQQPGLFTGPLYTIYKALSAIALARRLERERRVPVVPVFWVAGDDHDFHEANHATFLNAAGEATKLVLRERAAEAPALPMFREPCGPEIAGAPLGARTPTELPRCSVAGHEISPEVNLPTRSPRRCSRCSASAGSRWCGPTWNRQSAKWPRGCCAGWTRLSRTG